MPKKIELSVAQQRFISEYLKNGGNASAAFRTAFPHSKRWKDTSVHVKACKLLATDKVRLRLSSVASEITAEQKVTLERVVKEIDRIGHSDPLMHIYGDDGQLTDPKTWPEDVRRCVASIETFEEFEGAGKDRRLIGYTRKVKFWPKHNALEMLMKHTGGYERDNEQKNPFRNLPREQLRELERLISALESESVAGGATPAPDTRAASGVTH